MFPSPHRSPADLEFLTTRICFGTPHVDRQTRAAPAVHLRGARALRRRRHVSGMRLQLARERSAATDNFWADMRPRRRMPCPTPDAGLVSITLRVGCHCVRGLRGLRLRELRLKKHMHHGLNIPGSCRNVETVKKTEMTKTLVHCHPLDGLCPHFPSYVHRLSLPSS